MYVGGSIPDVGVFGEAVQSARGFNYEGHAHTYADAIIQALASRRQPATSEDFIKLISSTIAHELGHGLGLGHTFPDNTDLANVMDSSAEGNDNFLATSSAAEVFLSPQAPGTVVRRQNAFVELWLSFRCQRDENGLLRTARRAPVTVPQFITLDG